MRAANRARLSWQAIALAVACLYHVENVAAARQTHTVVIEGMQFHPASLTVRSGDLIVWRNQDLVPHTATAAGVFDSKAIGAQAAWSYIARKRGTFQYVCSFHPTMKATLVVQ